MDFWEKTEWDTEDMARPRNSGVAWGVVAVYSAIIAAAGLSCWAVKCGHGVMLVGGWILLGGMVLTIDAPDRRFWLAMFEFMAGVAAIIIGAVMMGAGS